MRREKVNNQRHLEKVHLHNIYKILFKKYHFIFTFSSSGNTILHEYVC